MRLFSYEDDAWVDYVNKFHGIDDDWKDMCIKNPRQFLLSIRLLNRILWQLPSHNLIMFEVFGR